jgi:hypothetical protein
MASTPNDAEVREEQRSPGSTETNPAAMPTPAPAKGSDDFPPKQPGSPQG